MSVHFFLSLSLTRRSANCIKIWLDNLLIESFQSPRSAFRFLTGSKLLEKNSIRISFDSNRWDKFQIGLLADQSVA